MLRATMRPTIAPEAIAAPAMLPEALAYSKHFTLLNRECLAVEHHMFIAPFVPIKMIICRDIIKEFSAANALVPARRADLEWSASP